MLFFDTSALVKRYAEEAGTKTVDRLIEERNDSVVITSLTVVEMTSAVRRKFDRGEVTERQRDDLLIAFFAEATDDYLILPLDPAVFEGALDLVLEDDLRTLDALQLGATLHVRETATDLSFVCADRKLARVARDHAVNTIDPTRT